MFKRVFDIIFSFIGLFFLSPFFLIIFLSIKIFDRGPAFFLQERIGYKGKIFKIWKFRTMVVDAEKKGGQITVDKDRRITKVGSFLRKHKLDEIPQLINILKGEMSFVGPRPEVLKYVQLYNNAQKKVLDLKPGLTDLASIKYRHENKILSDGLNPEEVYITQIMPDKISINLAYAQRANLVSDFGIILKTLFVSFI